MRKHILSIYADKIFDANDGKLDFFGKTTYETSTVEVSDPDEFGCGPTNLTKTLENTDADEFCFGPTMVTEQVENSDWDEIMDMGPTNSTFSKEDSDYDEFGYEFVNCSCEEDFDEFLLL